MLISVTVRLFISSHFYPSIGYEMCVDGQAHIVPPQLAWDENKNENRKCAVGKIIADMFAALICCYNIRVHISCHRSQHARFSVVDEIHLCVGGGHAPPPPPPCSPGVPSLSQEYPKTLLRTTLLFCAWRRSVTGFNTMWSISHDNTYWYIQTAVEPIRPYSSSPEAISVIPHIRRITLAHP